MPNPNPNPNQAMAEIPVDSLLARTQEAHAARRTAMNRSVTPPMAVLAMAVVRAMAEHGTCYACSTLTMA